MKYRSPFRIYLFVDGYTLKKVNEFYRFPHPFHSRIDFRSLKNWARREAMRVFAPQARYALMECHYYHPCKNPRACGSYGLSSFMRELRFAGFQVHCGRQVIDGIHPNMDLFSDALLFASYRRMDAVVRRGAPRCGCCRRGAGRPVWRPHGFPVTLLCKKTKPRIRAGF